MSKVKTGMGVPTDAIAYAKSGGILNVYMCGQMGMWEELKNRS